MAYTPISNGNTGLVARNIINGIGTGLDSHIGSSGSDVHGLGTISIQSASAVNISAGTITPLTNHTSLSGSDVHALGTIANQSASAVNLTGGTITGIAITANPIATVTTASEAISLTTSNQVVLVSASQVQVSLPTAVGNTGKIYHIKNTGSGSIVIAASGSQTIDGDNTVSITVKYSSLQIVSDGTNWNIL